MASSVQLYRIMYILYRIYGDLWINAGYIVTDSFDIVQDYASRVSFYCSGFDIECPGLGPKFVETFIVPDSQQIVQD